MSLRRVALAVALVQVAGATAVVWGGWHEFCDRSALAFYRNNAWPQTFIARDRLAVCAPFIIMAENGWIHQSTLTGFHFDPATQQLTEAGRLKIQSILTQHPDPFRTVYLVPGANSEETQARMNAVKETVQWVVGPGLPADVRLATSEPRGVPAEEIESISGKYRATVPDPRLPQASSNPNTP